MNCQISFIVAAAAAAVTAVTAVTAAVISEGGSVGFQTDADRVVSLSIPDIAAAVTAVTAVVVIHFNDVIEFLCIHCLC